MLSNNIKIALRNLAKHRFFSLLNIVGLALGMSSCLTVILIIRDQMSYDAFQPSQGRVFRVNCQQADGTRLASVPYPLGETLRSDFSVCEATVTLERSLFGVDATTAANVTLPLSGYFTEPSFFKVFGFRLEAGNEATALSEPNTIILSKASAERFFGEANPIGETLTLKDKGAYRITGVMAKPPGKTHLDFECLVSAASLNVLEQASSQEEGAQRVTADWNNRYMSYVYVLLKPGKSKTDLEAALTLVKENRSKAGEEDKEVSYFAQNIGNITPRPEQLANDGGGGAPWFFIWGMCAFVLILTIFPCLNYANLAIARSLARIKEVGVRKAVGARPADVKRLILVEAVLTGLLSLVLAWHLHLLLNVFVERFFPPQANLGYLQAKGWDWVIFIAFGLLVGLISGWLPARRLAKLDPAFALRGNKNGEMPHTARRFSWRTGMMVGQFALSLIFLIVVATLWSQLKYMTLADYGFQKENLLTIELKGNKPEILTAELSKDPRVLGICGSSVRLASNNLEGITIQKKQGEEAIGVHCASADGHFIPVMELELIAGQNFPENSTAAANQLLILNEKALERFQLGSPAEAVGQVLWTGDSIQATVTGVVKDFHYRILDHGIEPFALRYAPAEQRLLYVRLSPGDPALALTALGSIWKKVDPVHEFDATFMEDSIQKAYGHVTFVGGLVSFFALLALSLACMGLLGTVTYSVGRKVKEIGIRKVLGASAAQVTLALSRRFLVLLGVAMLIAVPAGYLLSNLFLRLFVYHISVGGLILGGSAAILLGLGLLTIGVQAGRAATANPVKALRSE